MKKILFILALAILPGLPAAAQDKVNQNDKYTIWQPGSKLDFDSFAGVAQPETVSTLEQAGIKMCPYIGFCAVLDVPKSHKDWQPGCEKPYFAAAFSRKESFLLLYTDVQLRYAQLSWDICELATRIARRNLETAARDLYGDERPAGYVTMQFQTAVNDGKEFGRDLNDALFKEVIIPDDEAKYQVYRTFVDEKLKELEAWATSEEEARRILAEKPLLKGYKRAQTLYGDAKERGTIQY